MKIIITEAAALKLESYVRNCDIEISGMGKTRIENNIIYIDDVCIFKQKCTPSNTVLDMADMMGFLTELIQKGENPKDFKLWWHSHVNMGVFWSSTDVNTMENSLEFPLLVSIVTNKRGEFKARIDLNEPIKISKDDIPVEIEFSYEHDDEIIAEIKEKITKVTYPATQTKVGYHVQYNSKTGSQMALPYSQSLYDDDEEIDYMVSTEPTNDNINEFIAKKQELEEEIETLYSYNKYETAVESEDELAEFIDKHKNKGIPTEYMYSEFLPTTHHLYRTKTQIDKIYA